MNEDIAWAVFAIGMIALIYALFAARASLRHYDECEQLLADAKLLHDDVFSRLCPRTADAEDDA